MPAVEVPKSTKQKSHAPVKAARSRDLVEDREDEDTIAYPPQFKNTVIAKINKHIEIAMIHDRSAVGMGKANVGIILDEVTISEVLAQRYETVGVSVIKTEDDLKKLVAKKPDLVFSGTEYFDFYDEDTKQHNGIWFSEYLVAHNIAYIGSPSKVYKNAYDKVAAKKVMLNAGIKTAQFFTTEPDELTSVQSEQLSFPVFVKPDRGGG